MAFFFLIRFLFLVVFFFFNFIFTLKANVGVNLTIALHTFGVYLFFFSRFWGVLFALASFFWLFLVFFWKLPLWFFFFYYYLFLFTFFVFHQKSFIGLSPLLLVFLGKGSHDFGLNISFVKYIFFFLSVFFCLAALNLLHTALTFSLFTFFR